MLQALEDKSYVNPHSDWSIQIHCLPMSFLFVASPLSRAFGDLGALSAQSDNLLHNAGNVKEVQFSYKAESSLQNCLQWDSYGIG